MYQYVCLCLIMFSFCNLWQQTIIHVNTSIHCFDAANWPTGILQQSVPEKSLKVVHYKIQPNLNYIKKSRSDENSEHSKHTSTLQDQRRHK